MKFYGFCKTLVFLFIIFSHTACSKFEEGPAISLLPVKTRIARDWKTEYVINLESGIVHSADFNGWLLSVSKNGTFVNTIIYDLQSSAYSGNWELIGKNQVKLSYSDNSGEIEEYYTITRLTKHELWLKDNFEEIHYYSDN